MGFVLDKDGSVIVKYIEKLASNLSEKVKDLFLIGV